MEFKRTHVDRGTLSWSKEEHNPLWTAAFSMIDRASLIGGVQYASSDPERKLARDIVKRRLVSAPFDEMTIPHLETLRGILTSYYRDVTKEHESWVQVMIEDLDTFIAELKQPLSPEAIEAIVAAANKELPGEIDTLFKEE